MSETTQQTIASLRKRGITPLQVLERTGILDRPTILAHVCGATPDDIRLMEKYPVGIAHAVKTYLKLGHPTAPVLEFAAAGIPVGLARAGTRFSLGRGTTEDEIETVLQLLPEVLSSLRILSPETRANMIGGQTDQAG